MKYAGWLILGLLVGAGLLWWYDHRDLIANRQKISGANQIISGVQSLFGGA